MLVVTRYQVPEGEEQEFTGLARVAVTALGERRGCEQVRFGRNADDPGLWVLASSWRTVGDYRRALSDPEVKRSAVPLMYRCVDEPTAYEDLITWRPDRGTEEHVSDLH